MASAYLNTHCKQQPATRPADSPPTCGPPSLLARSYAMPARWPLPPLRLIMEDKPGSCDYYRSIQPCCEFALYPERLVERPVREVLISALAHCNARLLEVPPRPCNVVDFGG